MNCIGPSGRLAHPEDARATLPRVDELVLADAIDNMSVVKVDRYYVIHRQNSKSEAHSRMSIGIASRTCILESPTAEHLKTWHRFTQWIFWITVHVAVLLVLMAVFLQ